MYYKKIHFVGIGGIGISAVAQFCLKKEIAVSGSNQGENNVFSVLIKAGMKKHENLFSQHEAKNIPKNCDLLVYTEAIPKNNPEILEAQKRKIPTKTYFEFLGEITRHYRTIAVAGTHGKTTTTGLISAGLLSAQFDLTVFVGAIMPHWGGQNFRFGKSEWCVLEACEYRDNFRFLSPEIVVLTNMELDHIDFFKSEDAYREAFERLCQKAQIVIFHAENLKDEGGYSFVKKCLENFKGKKIEIPSNFGKKIPLQIMGDYNQKNAQLALACGKILLEKTDPQALEKFIDGLGKFKGSERRQALIWEGEKKLSKKTASYIKIYDDYAHHPTEIEVTLRAFRQNFPHAHIAVIFEPHQYSRTKLFFKGFVETLTEADSIGLYPIYEARDTEAEKKSVSINILEKAILKNTEKESQKICKVVTNQADIQNFYHQVLVESSKKAEEKPVVFIFMGAGNISDEAKTFVKTLS